MHYYITCHYEMFWNGGCVKGNMYCKVLMKTSSISTNLVYYLNLALCTMNIVGTACYSMSIICKSLWLKESAKWINVNDSICMNWLLSIWICQEYLFLHMKILNIKCNNKKLYITMSLWLRWLMLFSDLDLSEVHKEMFLTFNF